MVAEKQREREEGPWTPHSNVFITRPQLLKLSHLSERVDIRQKPNLQFLVLQTEVCSPIWCGWFSIYFEMSIIWSFLTIRQHCEVWLPHSFFILPLFVDEEIGMLSPLEEWYWSLWLLISNWASESYLILLVNSWTTNIIYTLKLLIPPW